ncbi:MAG: autotransporter domain-containing protein [Rickettsiaceae bacterium]
MINKKQLSSKLLLLPLTLIAANFINHEICHASSRSTIGNNANVADFSSGTFWENNIIPQNNDWIVFNGTSNITFDAERYIQAININNIAGGTLNIQRDAIIGSIADLTGNAATVNINHQSGELIFSGSSSGGLANNDYSGVSSITFSPNTKVTIDSNANNGNGNVITLSNGFNGFGNGLLNIYSDTILNDNNLSFANIDQTVIGKNNQPIDLTYHIKGWDISLLNKANITFAHPDSKLILDMDLDGADRSIVFHDNLLVDEAGIIQINALDNSGAGAGQHKVIVIDNLALIGHTRKIGSDANHRLNSLIISGNQNLHFTRSSPNSIFQIFAKNIVIDNPANILFETPINSGEGGELKFTKDNARVTFHSNSHFDKIDFGDNVNSLILIDAPLLSHHTLSIGLDHDMHRIDQIQFASNNNRIKLLSTKGESKNVILYNNFDPIKIGSIEFHSNNPSSKITVKSNDENIVRTLGHNKQLSEIKITGNSTVVFSKEISINSSSVNIGPDHNGATLIAHNKDILNNDIYIGTNAHPANFKIDLYQDLIIDNNIINNFSFQNNNSQLQFSGHDIKYTLHGDLNPIISNAGLLVFDSSQGNMIFDANNHTIGRYVFPIVDIKFARVIAQGNKENYDHHVTLRNLPINPIYTASNVVEIIDHGYLIDESLKLIEFNTQIGHNQPGGEGKLEFAFDYNINILPNNSSIEFGHVNSALVLHNLGSNHRFINWNNDLNHLMLKGDGGELHFKSDLEKSMIINGNVTLGKTHRLGGVVVSPDTRISFHKDLAINTNTLSLKNNSTTIVQNDSLNNGTKIYIGEKDIGSATYTLVLNYSDMNLAQNNGEIKFMHPDSLIDITADADNAQGNVKLYNSISPDNDGDGIIKIRSNDNTQINIMSNNDESLGVDKLRLRQLMIDNQKHQTNIYSKIYAKSIIIGNLNNKNGDIIFAEPVDLGNDGQFFILGHDPLSTIRFDKALYGGEIQFNNQHANLKFADNAQLMVTRLSDGIVSSIEFLGDGSINIAEESLGAPSLIKFNTLGNKILKIQGLIDAKEIQNHAQNGSLIFEDKTTMYSNINHTGGVNGVKLEFNNAVEIYGDLGQHAQIGDLNLNSSELVALYGVINTEGSINYNHNDASLALHNDFVGNIDFNGKNNAKLIISKQFVGDVENKAIGNGGNLILIGDSHLIGNANKLMEVAFDSAKNLTITGDILSDKISFYNLGTANVNGNITGIIDFKENDATLTMTGNIKGDVVVGKANYVSLEFEGKDQVVDGNIGSDQKYIKEIKVASTSIKFNNEIYAKQLIYNNDTSVNISSINALSLLDFKGYHGELSITNNIKIQDLITSYDGSGKLFIDNANIVNAKIDDIDQLVFHGLDGKWLELNNDINTKNGILVKNGNSGGIIIKGKTINSDIDGPGSVNIQNNSYTQITGNIGHNNAINLLQLDGEADVSISGLLKTKVVYFTQDTPMSLILNKLDVVDDGMTIKTDYHNIHSLYLNHDLDASNISIGSPDKAIKSIVLGSNNYLNIGEKFYVSMVIPSASGQGSVELSSNKPSLNIPLGTADKKLSNIIIGENISILSEINSDNIDIKQNVSVSFENIKNKISVDLLDKEVSGTNIISNLNFIGNNGRASFKNHAVIEGDITTSQNGSGVIAFGDEAYIRNIGSENHALNNIDFTSTTSAHLLGNKYHANNISHANTALYIHKDNTVISGNFNGSQMHITLFDNKLNYKGNSTINDGLTISTNINSSTNRHGHIVLNNDSSIDLQNTETLTIYVNASTNLTELSDGEKSYPLFTKNNQENSGLILAKNIVLNANDTQSLVSWSTDGYNLTVKNNSEQVISDIKSNIATNQEHVAVLDSLFASQDLSYDSFYTTDAGDLLNQFGQMNEEEKKESMDRIQPAISYNNSIVILHNQISENILSHSTIRQIPIAIGVASGDNDDSISYGMWIRPFFGYDKQNKYKTNPGYNIRNTGGSVGFDWYNNDSSYLGAAWTFAHSKVRHKNAKNNDKTEIDLNIASLYLSQSLPRNFFMQSILSFSFGKAKNYEHRLVDSGVMEIAYSKYHPKAYFGKILAGYHYKINQNFVLSPEIGFSTIKSKSINYKEAGTKNSNLTVYQKDKTSTAGIAGLKLSYKVEYKNMTITPSIHAMVNRYLNHKPTYFNSTLSGSTSPLVQSYSSQKTTGNFSVNLDFLNDKFDVMLSYNGYIAKKYYGQEGAVQLRVRF